MRSKLRPINRGARMLRRHWHHVRNDFVHRITNAGSESMNAKIQRVKARSCGFRNRGRFRQAVYFHCRGLDLYPASSARPMNPATPNPEAPNKGEDMAKKFLQVSCGVFLLAASYQLGVVGAVAQGQELQIGSAFPAGCGVADRTVYVMRRDGSGQPIAIPDPLPGASQVVGVWAETSGSLDVHALVVLANGDMLGACLSNYPDTG